MNIRSVTQAARLLPSSSGWFLAMRTITPPPCHRTLDRNSSPPNDAEGAWRTESATSSLVAVQSVSRSTPVRSAAMAR
jgi:hypothetical protein